MNPKVDDFFRQVDKWQQELELLRTITLDCGLTEEIKWGVPCYTYQKSNIILIHGFKEYCALLFMKGALLNDAEGILIQQTENVQSGRQIRFQSTKEIAKMEGVLKAYIYEAIEVERAGLKVELKKTDEYPVPEELQNKLNKNTELKSAFYALTPGRQRGYLLHFSQAKQAKTREERIEHCIPRILKGKGFHDCICGLSKRMPNCDGSHKHITNK
ncbi:MAG: YdeI/OmpD-associated family protein [Bacteroidetes bacterium]|nr:YdeI/OmpD-associated family protein [Bacteroidota bacterium]